MASPAYGLSGGGAPLRRAEVVGAGATTTGGVYRPIRVAHIGNVANNAYSIAKFQRRVGLPADMYHYRNEFIMGHPEWEDADFDAELDPYAAPDWAAIAFTNGYARPSWARYLAAAPDPAPDAVPATDPARVVDAGTGAAGAFGRGAAPHQGPSAPGALGISAQGGLAEVARGLLRRGVRRQVALSRRQRLSGGERLQLLVLSLLHESIVWLSFQRLERGLWLNDALRRTWAAAEDVNQRSYLARAGVRLRVRDLMRFTHWDSFRATCRPYDLVQLYGLEVAKGTFLPPEQPFVAFEHGTLRGFPFEQSLQGRLLSLGHQAADWTVITNPDTIGSAQRLQLERYTFIPHPLDEGKYVDAPTPLRDRLRQEVGCDLVFLCPTRHEWSDAFDSKRSDRAIRAFARYVQTAAALGLPRAALVLCEWGRDLAASKDLVRNLGIAGSVAWRPPMHKLKLLDYYRAADVVLDQFHDAVGAFGTVTAEALSCSRPVVMYFNPAVHEWCLPEMPPIESARTEDEILERLVSLAGSRERREQVGAASRRWIERWHGWRRCTDLHMALYQEIVERRRLTASVVPASAATSA